MFIPDNQKKNYLNNYEANIKIYKLKYCVTLQISLKKNIKYIFFFVHSIIFRCYIFFRFGHRGSYPWKKVHININKYFSRNCFYLKYNLISINIDKIIFLYK